MTNTIETTSVQDVLQEVAGLRDYLLTLCENSHARIAHLNASQLKSAKNLLQYVAFRSHDIRPLQERLAELGLSSLGRAEPHVMATVNAVHRVLFSLAKHRDEAFNGVCAHVGIREGRELLETHADRLMGTSPPQRGTRIMVTLPSEAAGNPGLIEGLLAAGMTCARINCAHDGAKDWGLMIQHLRAAEKKLCRTCKVLMDLGGPKLRTGPLPGVPVVKARARRNLSGRVIQPAQVWLAAEGRAGFASGGGVVLPVTKAFLSEAGVGTRVRFQDARGMPRTLTVVEQREGAHRAECPHNCYIRSGEELELEGSARKTCVGVLPEAEEPLVLKPGETLLLTRSLEPGAPALYDAEGRVAKDASIGCTLPQVFSQAKPGERIWFDDGKIGGVIREMHGDWLRVEITQCAPDGEKLRSDKGINLPESNLQMPALTPKDIRDLEFVAAHADMVGLSFVQNPEDVQDLLARLKALTTRAVNIILKIETRRAFQNLPDLMLAAMQAPLAGVMIARGDLAIECGFERMAEVQEEILWICEAAHMPVIWATQVLESAAKSGQPSRAEITDAAMASRAECVMLNKGPYILDAVRILNGVLSRMQEHQDKKRTLLRRLSSWKSLVNE